MNQNKLLNYLLAAMIVWVPNQLHLPADLGVKGLNSINLLFLAILYFVHQRNKRLPPSDATPMKGVFIAYFCMLGWAFLAGQLSDPSLMMDDLTALKNSVFFMCLYFVFFHAVRDETSLRYMFYTVLFVAAVAGLEAIREGIDYGFGVYGETKRAAGPFGTNYKASNLAAVFYSMFMPVFAAVALYQKGRPLVRWGGISGVGILLLAIFCTYSRQAYLIVAAMLLLMTMKRNVVLGLLILLAVVNYESWVPEGVVTRLAMTEQVSEETGEEQLDESTESRFVLWEGAGRLLLSRPWGIGLNHFKREIGSEVPSLSGMDAHNFLVLITTEAGPLGGIMTLVLYGALSTLAWRLWKLAKTADQRTLAAGYAGATIAVMLGNLYGSRLLDGAVTGNYWILTALAARYWVMLKNGVLDETVVPGSEDAADSDAATTATAADAATAMGAGAAAAVGAGASMYAGTGTSTGAGAAASMHGSAAAGAAKGTGAAAGSRAAGRYPGGKAGPRTATRPSARDAYGRLLNPAGTTGNAGATAGGAEAKGTTGQRDASPDSRVGTHTSTAHAFHTTHAAPSPRQPDGTRAAPAPASARPAAAKPAGKRTPPARDKDGRLIRPGE